MRHRVAGVKLGRTPAHRRALLRNLVTALLEHEVVRTTDAKAKELRRWGDRVITLGKQGTLHARRRAGVGWLRKLWFLHVMVGVCLVSATAYAREPDGCQLRFPRSLAAAIEKRSPDHRLPRVADVPRRDRLAWIGRQGGDECLLVAT